MVVTSVTVFVLNVQTGIYAGLLLSYFLLLYRTSYPTILTLGMSSLILLTYWVIRPFRYICLLYFLLYSCNMNFSYVWLYCWCLCIFFSSSSIEISVLLYLLQVCVVLYILHTELLDLLGTYVYYVFIILYIRVVTLGM